MVKRRDEGPKAVTANRLADGAVVFLGREGGWSPRVQDAAIAALPAEAAGLLAQAAQAVGSALVVNPYLIDVTLAGAPALYRERIRAHGPSIAVPGAGEG